MPELDDYLAGLAPDVRAAFQHVRDVAMDAVPEALQGTSYGMAALRYQGKPLLGFRLGKGHLSLFPFSAGVVEGVRERLAGYELSRGTIRFSVAHPLPDDVLREIVDRRVAEIAGTAR